MQYGTDTKIKRLGFGRFFMFNFLGRSSHDLARKLFRTVNDMQPYSINFPVARFLTAHAGYDTSLFKPANMILDGADRL